MPDDPDNYDLDFGYMQFNGVDAWDCNVGTDLPHPPSYYLAIHIWSDETGPTDLQRERVRWLKQNYSQLWPRIVEAICELLPDLNGQADLAEMMREYVAIHLGEHAEDSLELVYDLVLPNDETQGCFITVDNGSITRALIAD